MSADLHRQPRVPVLSRAYNTARRRGWWAGHNPVKDVQPIRVPRRLAPDWLRPHEVGPVLEQLSESQRSLFATALLAGLRKGELRALRESDADLEARTIRVARTSDGRTS